jgi:hypothetical protein
VAAWTKVMNLDRFDLVPRRRAGAGTLDSMVISFELAPGQTA